MRSQNRELGDVRARSEGRQASGEHYLRSQRQVWGGRSTAIDRPRPLEFDESGFPIGQRLSSFAERVTRLLTP